MFRWFLKYVVGGSTGKRESAMMTFMLWVVYTVFIVWREMAGASTEVALSMWMVITPFVFAWMAAAFGFEWVSQQTKWAGPRMQRAVFDPDRSQIRDAHTDGYRTAVARDGSPPAPTPPRTSPPVEA